MAEHKPPPRILDPDEERRIQRFLERAAPIVLENSVLDTPRWGELLTLAEEMELSDEQFRRTIDELRERGVIQTVQLDGPKPPPLPSQIVSSNKPPLASADTETDFSLAPPVPPPRTSSSENASQDVPPSSNPEAFDPVARFQRTAAAIIAQQRGTGPKAQILLAAAANELGISEEKAREILRSLHSPERREPEPTAAPPVVSQPIPPPVGRRSPPPSEHKQAKAEEEESRRRRWRVEGEPDPEPPTPKKTPAEIFRDYVRTSLEQLRGVQVSEDLERRILRQGTRVLGLSPVFARHLLIETAQEQQRVLPHSDEVASEKERNEPAPLLKAFLNSAAPVLAKHRGINAKSRVMLSALAREQGLTETQVDEALALLQHRSAGDAEDSRQAHRIESFRLVVKKALSELPHRILTANIQSKLAEQGETLHGVEEDRIGPLVREVAESLSISIVTLEQAEQHVRKLVEDLMEDATRLPPDVRERVFAEGRQWGLTDAQIEDVIAKRASANLRLRRSERNLTNFALASAGIALVFLAGLIAWIILDHEVNTSAKPTADKDESVSLPTAPQPRDQDDSWWSAEMSVAIAAARQEFPQLRAPLMDIDAIDPRRRISAYSQLVQQMLRDTTSEANRDRLAEVLSWCCALDPDDTTAETTASNLLKQIPTPEAGLNENAKSYAGIFRAARTVLNALERSRADEIRAQRMAQILGNTIGTHVDHEQDARELEQQCLGALAERLFRLLIIAAAAQPNSVGALHAAIATEAVRYLDGEILDNLNADFLVALAASATDAWRDYEDLLLQTINSTHAYAVVKLVDLYERTDNKELQEFMTRPLMRRVGSTREPLSVSELADKVRKSLGISAKDMTEGRWVTFSREAHRVLVRVQTTSESEKVMMQDVLDLQHLANLGCALSQGEMGAATVASLRENGAPRLKESETDPTKDEPPRSAESSESNRLVDQSLYVLADRRSSWTDRVERLAFLARQADRYSDLHPRQAKLLAAYLLKLKNDSEHNQVRDLASQIARWPNLRLAMADEVVEATLRPEQRNDLLSNVLGEKIHLGEGREDREVAQRLLLESVLDEIDITAIKPDGSSKAYDAIAAHLCKSYTLQNSLLNAAAEAEKWTMPSAVLRPMIEAYAERLVAKVNAPAATKVLDQIPHALIAVEYVANDDLERTVLFERQWISVLAQATAEQNKTVQKEIDRILQDLATADRNATHILQQLRNSQIATVQLWLLWAQSE